MCEYPSATMAVAAELRIFHSRHPSATRRVSPDPIVANGPRAGDAAVYLGCLVLGANLACLDATEAGDLDTLTAALDERRRPPRALRHRIQLDRHGLDSSVHRLVTTEAGWRLALDVHGPPAPQVVGALVAFDLLPTRTRSRALAAAAAVRGLAASGAFGSADDLHDLVAAAVFGSPAISVADSRVVWALETLDLPPDRSAVESDLVLRAYRRGVRAAHPDHGADDDGAADRLMALRRARDLLLGV